MELKKYIRPDFSQEKFLKAADARLVQAPEDGIAPDNFHATSIFPEYFHINGQWLLAEESRMDCVAVYENGRIKVKEFRNIRKGDFVVTGRSENAEEGIYVHPDCFAEESPTAETFAFRKRRSRETGFSKDYDELCEILRHDKNEGKIMWVLGPALVFDSEARTAFSKLIKEGYVHAMMAGNALAVHDLEAAYLGTALGNDIYTQQAVKNGHYNHLSTINKVREYGSIASFLKEENINDGIICELEKQHIPYVLAGSLRDDGPLPEVIGNVYEAQEKMRLHLSEATTVICVATMLHSIAAGNITPSYRMKEDGEIRQVYFYCVDISEFTANKLTDRGSLSSRSIITNARDFMVTLSNKLGL